MKTSANDAPNGVAPTPRPRTPALVRRSVAALALGLVGCGGGGNDGMPPQIPPQAPPPDVTAPQPEVIPPQAPPPPPQVNTNPGPPPQIPPPNAR